MIHIYKDEMYETDIKLLTNKFIEVKSPELLLLTCINFEHIFALVHLLLLLNLFLLNVIFQYPLKSSKLN